MSAVIPALAAPSPDTGAVLKHLVFFRRLSEPEMVLTAGGMAAGILGAALTNANEITTFLLIQT